MRSWLRKLLGLDKPAPVVKVKLLYGDSKMPKYETEGAAGMDLSAHLHTDEPLVLGRGERMLVRTGIAVEVPIGYEMQIRPRSGLMLKKGVFAHFGTIDSDYRGEVGVILYNASNKDFVIESGDRIAQAVIAEARQAVMMEASFLSMTERGGKGFGSTGV